MWRFTANRALRTSAARLGHGAPKPGWSVEKKQLYGPEIPDKQYHNDHIIYTGFTLWLRGIRPHLEKAIGDSLTTLKTYLLDPVFGRAMRYMAAHNPEFRGQIVAFLAFYFTASTINLALNRYYQRVMDVKNYMLLEAAKDADEASFWKSESEDRKKRMDNYFEDYKRLECLWKEALAAADANGHSFKLLCAHLNPEKNATSLRDLPPPITWRFGLIPYGENNEDAKTFSVPAGEESYRALALNFTYNNLAYNWGDYIDRRDNKSALMRPSRMMFTDVIIPPTK